MLVLKYYLQCFILQCCLYVQLAFSSSPSCQMLWNAVGLESTDFHLLWNTGWVAEGADFREVNIAARVICMSAASLNGEPPYTAITSILSSTFNGFITTPAWCLHTPPGEILQFLRLREWENELVVDKYRQVAGRESGFFGVWRLQICATEERVDWAVKPPIEILPWTILHRGAHSLKAR